MQAYENVYEYDCECLNDPHYYPESWGQSGCFSCGKKSVLIKNSNLSNDFLVNILRNIELNNQILHLWQNEKGQYYSGRLDELRFNLRLLIKNTEQMLKVISSN